MFWNVQVRAAARHMAAVAFGAAVCLAGASAQAATTNIVFIGNSFTYGEGSAVKTFHPEYVTDLNGTGYGGIASVFKAFTLQAGLDYTVSIEAVSGYRLDDHAWYQNPQLARIDRPWDVVVMHTSSMLDYDYGAGLMNPQALNFYSNWLANKFTAQNPNVNVQLMATWSRADQTYPSNGYFAGQSIYQMGELINTAYVNADAASANVDGVIPVGLSWNRAIANGFADANPYDGIDAGKVNLWGGDSYHASRWGSYLEALTIFGRITGLDPRTLGANESVAVALGITSAQAVAMQQLAYAQLSAVPEPATTGLMAAGGLVLLWARRRRAAH